MLTRRNLLATTLAAPVAACATRTESLGTASTRLRKIETMAGGRLGSFIFDTATGDGAGWRAGERFAHCSSFKLSLAAMVLSQAERGQINGHETVRWTKDDLMSVSPVTSAHVASGLTLLELARATQVTSDNAAANILLKRLGGPQSLTTFWRSLGDATSRLDRYEPDLNTTPPGTTLDTTAPEAMARTLSKLVTGKALGAAAQDTLKRWMTETAMGLNRLRAGFPPDWIAGDKTGTGISDEKQTYVDLAFGGPPGRAPLIVTAYYEPAILAEPMDPLALAVLKDVGRIAAALI